MSKRPYYLRAAGKGGLAKTVYGLSYLEVAETLAAKTKEPIAITNDRGEWLATVQPDGETICRGD